MKNFVQNGTTLPLVMTAAVVSGQLINIGKFTGVCAVNGAIGDTVEVALTGVYSLPKASADVYSQGAQLKTDGTGLVTAAGTIVFGVAAAAAGAGSTTVLARLTPSAA